MRRFGLPLVLLFSLVALAALFQRRGAEHALARTGAVSPRKITYWEKWNGFEGEAMERVVQLFNQRERQRAEHEPGYRPIEVRQVTISKWEQKLLVAIAGGNPPDVAGTISFFLPAYVDKGALLDLTDRLKGTGLDESHFAAAYYDLGRYRGRVYALPTTPGALALHYNRAQFREAGLDPDVAPHSIEELDALAEKLTKWEVTLPDGSKQMQTGYLPEVPADQKRLVQVGFLPSEPGLWHWAWGYFFGGSLIDGDRISTADPENVRAFEWVASYSKKLGVDKIQRFRSGFGNIASAQNAFLSGKVAMVVQGVWMFNFIEKYGPGLDWAAAEFPHPADRPDLQGATDVEADQIVIPRGARHPDEAFEFIKFVGSQEAMEMLCLGQKKHSPLRVMSEQFVRQHPHPYLRLFHELSQRPNGFHPPKIGVYNEYLRTLTPAVDEIIALRRPPSEALAHVEQRMQKAYDRELRAARRRQNAATASGGCELAREEGP
jgi:ABC-type glycerol-3-phosphate transport system substrate-binding protein